MFYNDDYTVNRLRNQLRNRLNKTNFGGIQRQYLLVSPKLNSACMKKLIMGVFEHENEKKDLGFFIGDSNGGNTCANCMF